MIEDNKMARLLERQQWATDKNCKMNIIYDCKIHQIAIRGECIEDYERIHSEGENKTKIKFNKQF